MRVLAEELLCEILRRFTEFSVYIDLYTFNFASCNGYVVGMCEYGTNHVPIVTGGITDSVVLQMCIAGYIWLTFHLANVLSDI